MNEEGQKEKQQDGLALIIGGLFILALIFAAYNYFKSGKEDSEDTAISDQGMETSIDEKGDLNGDGAKDTKTDSKETDTVVLGDKQNPKSDTQQIAETDNSWVANNYTDGDIKGGSYTVKQGDTLWEIAEGAYGDGSQWTKILQANQSEIGYLPNGQQSLITVNQVLVLP